MPVKHGYLLPEIINPERICVQLNIPNDQRHLLAFWGQLAELGSALNWDNDENHTALQVSAVWRDVYKIARDNFYGDGCMGCCPDELYINVQQYRADQRAQQQLNRMMDDPDIGTAASFGAPSTFNGDNSDARQWALCRTINRLIRSTFDTMAMGYNLASDIVEFTQRYFPSAQPLAGFFAEITNAITGNILNGLANDCEAMRAVACCMRDNLTGQDTTIDNLQNSLGDCNFSFGSNEAQIAYMVNSALQSDDNARAFIASMNEDYQSAGSSTGANAQDCDCDCDCIETIIPVDFMGTGCEFEYMGGCVWKVTQSTPYTPTPHYQASIADQLGRCFYASVPSNPYFVQATSDHDVLTCAGVQNGTVGGWEGGCYKTAWWRVGLVPMVTYYKLEVKQLGDEGCA